MLINHLGTWYSLFFCKAIYYKLPYCKIYNIEMGASFHISAYSFCKIFDSLYQAQRNLFQLSYCRKVTKCSPMRAFGLANDIITWKTSRVSLDTLILIWFILELSIRYTFFLFYCSRVSVIRIKHQFHLFQCHHQWWDLNSYKTYYLSS